MLRLPVGLAQVRDQTWRATVTAALQPVVKGDQRLVPSQIPAVAPADVRRSPSWE